MSTTSGDVQRASPRQILDLAGRQGVTKQPIFQGPKPPRIGLDAYHAARSARTQPGVAESRSAAARGLRALRQAGDMGRAEASALRAGATGSSTTERGQNMVDRIISNRQIRGRSFHRRGISANNKGYEVGSGTFAATTTRAERRSAAATELAGLRRMRNANLAATGERGPSEYWRGAAGSVQVANPVLRTQVFDASGNQSISGANRPQSATYAERLLAGRRDRRAQTAATNRANSRNTSAASARGLSSYTPAQLREARSQAGDVGDYVTRSMHTPPERRKAVSKAAELGLNLKGRNSDEKFNNLVAILGVPPKAAGNIKVRVSADTINLENVHSNGGGLSRTIKVDRADGRPMVYNELYQPNATARAEGMATDHYNRQILAARAAGISRIKVSGAGFGNGNPDTSGREWTGYHAWVEFGFDGPVGSHGRNVFRNAHPALANVTESSTFNETIHHPDPAVAAAARTAWRAHGVGTREVTLDISDPDSSSMKVYKNHWKKRRNQDWRQSNAMTNASRNGNYDIYN